MWWDVLRTGSTLMLPGASQWRLQISACSAIGCLSVTSAMEISTLLTQLAVSSLEPYLILAVTRLKSMDSGRCRLAEAIPTQGRRTSCSLRLARTMNRMGCWASLVQSPPNSAETPNKKLLQVRQAARWLSANEKGRFSDTLTQTALFLLLFPSSTKLIVLSTKEDSRNLSEGGCRDQLIQNVGFCWKTRQQTPPF